MCLFVGIRSVKWTRRGKEGEKSLLGNKGFCVDHAGPCIDFLSLPREKTKGHWNEFFDQRK